MAGKGEGFSNAIFAVGAQPYCLWGWDLRTRNRQFLAGIAYDYFSYIADVHAAQLDGDQRQHAAISLRAGFHHGLETLFTLLGAAVQAPGCAAAWILKSDTGQLRQFVRDVQAESVILNFVGLRQVSWTGIAEKTLLAQFTDEAQALKVRSGFGDLWAQFAREYLESAYIDEYNSLKHGFRTRPGGFTLSVAESPGPNRLPDESDFKPVAGSDFGSSFLRAKPITGAPPAAQGRDPHFQLETQSLNWDPMDMVSGLKLISMSIRNICGGLRWRGGEPRETIPKFLAPPPDDAPFWDTAPGVSHLVQNQDVEERHIERYTRDHLFGMIEAAAQSYRKDEGTS